MALCSLAHYAHTTLQRVSCAACQACSDNPECHTLMHATEQPPCRTFGVIVMVPLNTFSVLLHRCTWALMGRTCKLFRQDWTAMCHQEEAQCWWTRFSTSIKRTMRVTQQPQRRARGRWMPGEDNGASLPIATVLKALICAIMMPS